LPSPRRAGGGGKRPLCATGGIGRWRPDDDYSGDGLGLDESTQAPGSPTRSCSAVGQRGVLRAPTGNDHASSVPNRRGLGAFGLPLVSGAMPILWAEVPRSVGRRGAPAVISRGSRQGAVARVARLDPGCCRAVRSSPEPPADQPPSTPGRAPPAHRIVRDPAAYLVGRQARLARGRSGASGPSFFGEPAASNPARSGAPCRALVRAFVRWRGPLAGGPKAANILA